MGDISFLSSYVYGGTYNLFAHTFHKMGIEATFCGSRFHRFGRTQKAIRPNTKAVFAGNHFATLLYVCWI